MQKTFDVTGPLAIEVQLAAGEIEIDPTLDGRAEVELVAHDEESQRLVEEARIELRDHHLVVDVPHKRGGGFNLSLIFGRTGIGCRIRCPAGSSVTAKTKSADVTARGTIGGLDVRTASGDVEAVDVAGSVNVKSASGDIRIHTVGGGLNVQTASGDVEIGAVRGPANVQTASGDVEIDAADADVHAMVVSGDLELGAVVRGQVNAQSVSGDVTVGVRRGSTAYLDCNTLSGDTSSDLDLQGDAPADGGPLVEVRVKTVSGDIRITRAPAPAQSEEVHA